MKRQMPKTLAIIIAAMSLFNLLCFYALHSMWSGIVVILGTISPYIIISVMFLIATACIIMFFYKVRPLVWNIVFGLLSLFFFCVEIYMLIVCKGTMRYILREFGYALLGTVAIGFVVFLVFFLKKTPLKDNNIFKFLVTFIFIFSLAISYFDFDINSFTSTPVVYAVNDQYQIVYTTKAKGTAWVEINGKIYNDTYAGYRRSESRVHKITVPMEELDLSKGYTIYTRSMILRGPYNSLQGRTLQKAYSWKGIDESDGVNYYVISDTHEYYKSAIKAASYYGDSLDFLIMDGDISSFLDEESDISIILKIAGGVTNGEIPVVYARGNHETKGLIADQLYNYVGSKNQSFYYTFRLQNIWGIVLDMGEDHADDWWEFYDAAEFNDYREEQILFMQEVIENKENEYEATGVDYRIGVCHITPAAVYREDEYPKYKYAYADLLNEMNLSVMFSGHRHQLMYIESGWENGKELKYDKNYCGYTPSKIDMIKTTATFPAIIVSRRSLVQEITSDELVFGEAITGLAVSTDFQKTTMKYTNSKGEELPKILSPWFDKNYGSEITLIHYKD